MPGARRIDTLPPSSPYMKDGLPCKVNLDFEGEKRFLCDAFSG